MNILISNDDGISARGLRELVDAVTKEGAVYVVAPSFERSAAAHSITIRRDIRMQEVDYDRAKLAFSVDGTPADCVKLGVYKLRSLGIDIDVVFSGINHGENLGTDTLYSGTVSAAIEGNLMGVPSAAFSLAAHYPEYFDYTKGIAVDILKNVYGDMNAKTILNVNVPHLPENKIRGTRITRLGKREYDNWFDEKTIDEKTSVFRYSGDPTEEDSDDMWVDIIAQQEGYASITPLKYDLTNIKAVKDISEWRLEK